MRSSIAICFAGSGGAGAITAGSTFLQAAARAGYYGLMTKLSAALAVTCRGMAWSGGAARSASSTVDCGIARPLSVFQRTICALSPVRRGLMRAGLGVR